MTVVLLLLCLHAAAAASIEETTPAAPTLTTAAAAAADEDQQQLFHCSSRPTSMCGSRIAKCQLLKACNCTMTPADLVSRSCECCNDCIECLGNYLTECCACVGLCELSPLPPDATDAAAAAAEEQDEYEVEQLEVPDDVRGAFENGLARASTKDGASEVYTYSIIEEPGPLGSRLDRTVARSIAEPAENCTVVYFAQCMSRRACVERCRVLLASSSRWFVTGCCECAGQHCLEGGSSTARCRECRNEDFPQIDDYDDDEEEEEHGIPPKNVLREL